MLSKKAFSELSYSILSTAIEVPKVLGPGLLESIYHKCMAREFNLRGIQFISELNVPVMYKGVNVTTDLRCDFLVEDSIVVDLKSINYMAPVHEAIMYTYMQLLKKPKGILINFHCTNIIKEGQKQLVNEMFRQLPD